MSNKEPEISEAEFTRLCENYLINTTEAAEILGISKARLNKLVEKETVKPVLKLKRETLYFKPTILKRADSLKGKYNKQ